MGEGEELWKKYCSFFDKDFSEPGVQRAQAKGALQAVEADEDGQAAFPERVKKFEDVPANNSLNLLN